MSCFETGSNHQLLYVPESTFGTFPASPVMKPVKFTQLSLKGARTPFQSETIRSDQMLSDVRMGQKSVTGDINFELSYADFDDLLEAQLGGTWSTVAGGNDTGTDWEVTNATTFSKTAHGLSIAADDVIEVTGFATANNNGYFKVDSVTANTIVITESKLTVEATGPTVTVNQLTTSELDGATATPSFSMERGFLGTGDYEQFTGVTPNSLTLSIIPNGITTGVWGFLGSTTTTGTSSSAGSITPASAFSPMDAFNGSLTLDAASIPVSSIELNFTRNLTEARTIGNDGVECLVPGRNILTGTFVAYFEDLDLIDKFNNETEAALVVTVADGSGGGANSYTFSMPRIKFTDNDHPIANEQSVLQTIPFQALYDAATDTMITITR